MASSTVTAYPRIHIGLLDLGFATSRKYGGAGIMLDLPTSIVSARPALVGVVHGLEQLDLSAQNDIRRAVAQLTDRYQLPPTEVEIRNVSKQHVGLGSKTALVLASMVATATVHGLNVAETDLKELSERGGVSGVGVHGFFSGGLVVDAGQLQDDCAHGPSSERVHRSPSLLMMHAPIDVRWTFYLILPEGRKYCDGDEVALFREKTPVPRHQILEALAALYHGIVPALLTCDLSLLRTSLFAFSRCGFKRVEIEAQSSSVAAAITEIEAIEEVAVGMSSVGPLLYAASNLPREFVEPLIRKVCEKIGAELLAICGPRNSAHVVTRS